ncbi:MAG: DUF3352 domain-containing protein [Phormidesmis sp. CAN_BIN36]|nr:DUF3352 domain-containing protein [Phormidesmis sp. CAN_BIN36]
MLLRRILLPAVSALILAPSATLSQAVPDSVANVLPSDTTGVLLINTEEKTWEELSRFGLFPADFSFPGSLYPIQPGLNFSTDIQPWLGQVAIALLPLKSNPDRSLTIASVKDNTLVPKFLERLKAVRKEVAIEHDYKGIKILEWQPEKPTVTPCEKESDEKPCSETRVHRPMVLRDISRSFLTTAKPDALTMPSHLPAPEKNTGIESPFAPKGLAIAVLPGYVVTAFTIGPIQQLIDAQESGKLADNPLFQRTIRQSQFARSPSSKPVQPLMIGYGDYAQILTATTAFNQAQINSLPPGFPTPPKLDPEKLDILGRYYDVMDGYVWAQPDGLHMQVGIHFKQAVPQSLLNSMTTRNQILNRLPEVNYVVSNGQNLALFWQALTTGLELDPSTKKGLAQFRRSSQSLVGLDDRDIFPWMKGEIATIMYPTRQGFLPATLPNLDLGFGLMIQTRDRTAAEAALRKLDRLAQTRIDKDLVNTRTVQGQTITTWDVPFVGKNQTLLSHGWVAKDTVLILGGGGAMTEFSPKPRRSLPQSANFKAAIAPLSNANLGYSYINGGAVMSLVNRLVPILSRGTATPGLNEIQESLGSIRSISGTSSVTSGKVQSEAFMALATTRTTPLTASQLIELGQTKLTGNIEGAIANFTRAIRLEPNNADAYYERGLARSMVDANDAIADYTQALRIDSKSVKAYSRRSYSRQQLFDYAGALQDLDRAIQLEPDQNFYLRRSGIRTVQGNYQDAIADANQSIRLEPSSSVAYSTRCYAQARGLSDFKGALADCDQAIELDPESTTNFTSRCYVRANLNDNNALKDCDRALEIDPEYSAIYEDRGLAHAALGNKKAALEDLQKAVEIFKQQGDAMSQQRVEKAIEKLS